MANKRPKIDVFLWRAELLGLICIANIINRIKRRIWFVIFNMHYIEICFCVFEGFLFILPATLWVRCAIVSIYLISHYLKVQYFYVQFKKKNIALCQKTKKDEGFTGTVQPRSSVDVDKRSSSKSMDDEKATTDDRVENEERSVESSINHFCEAS